MKTGDVFTWKETDTKWLVYLQRLEERAYFRAEIRKCEDSIEIDGKPYWFFARRYGQEDALWHTSKNISWNELNYSLEMYITKDEVTQGYFKRFQIIEFGGKPWEVQDVNIYATDGFVVILLKEHYTNTIEDKVKEEQAEKPSLTPSSIDGPLTVYPYDEVEYTYLDDDNGVWEVDNLKAKIINQTSKKVSIAITTGKSGNFNLIYKKENGEIITNSIVIESL